MLDPYGRPEDIWKSKKEALSPSAVVVIKHHNVFSEY